MAILSVKEVKRMKEDELFIKKCEAQDQRFEIDLVGIRRVTIIAGIMNIGIVIANDVPLLAGKSVYRETAKLNIKISVPGDVVLYIVYIDK